MSDAQLWGTDTLTMPRTLPGDLCDKINETLKYYLRCSFDGANEFPIDLNPEEWSIGATLSVWHDIIGYLDAE